jgi:hypothetical protein
VRRRPSADLVALVLGAGVVLVLLVLASVALVDSIERGGSAAPSENLTQILSTILGGIVGALGAYLGRSAIEGRRRPDPPAEREHVEEGPEGPP